MAAVSIFRLSASIRSLSWVSKVCSAQSRCITAASPAVTRRVETMVARHAEIVEMLNSGEHAGSASLGKEMSQLALVASITGKTGELRQELTSLKELLIDAESEGDVEMEEECSSEMDRINDEMQALGAQLVEAILPRDENDIGTDAVLEVRAGTGGDEAALFAAELLATFEKTAKGRGWTLESLGKTTTDIGGVKEAAVLISSGSGGGFYFGDDENVDVESLDRLGPYGLFKFESGVHRVQRVPVNDVRIHTSAVSVAVLPSIDESSGDPKDTLPMSELKIETMRASGAGGQHVNTTDSAVRITHVPSGITASIQDERSQHKNKAKALKLITARVRDKIREEEERERGDARANLMGGGDRSERIRTYNWPQDRITDHRSKQTEHGISKLFESGAGNGLVSVFAPSMRSMHKELMLKEMEDEKR